METTSTSTTQEKDKQEKQEKGPISSNVVIAGYYAHTVRARICNLLNNSSSSTLTIQEIFPQCDEEERKTLVSISSLLCGGGVDFREAVRESIPIICCHIPHRVVY